MDNLYRWTATVLIPQTLDGFVGSKEGTEETREKLEEALSEHYGQGAYQVLEFRPATEEEEADVRKEMEKEEETDTKTLH